MFEFPELPQSLEGLSADELDALRVGFVNTFKTVKEAEELTAADNDYDAPDYGDVGADTIGSLGVHGVVTVAMTGVAALWAWTGWRRSPA